LVKWGEGKDRGVWRIPELNCWRELVGGSRVDLFQCRTKCMFYAVSRLRFSLVALFPSFSFPGWVIGDGVKFRGVLWEVGERVKCRGRVKERRGSIKQRLSLGCAVSG